MNGEKLLIRSDANAQIGTGHLMRCLALGQAWQAEGGTAFFVSCCQSDTLRHRIESAGFAFVPLEQPYPDPGDLPATFELLKKYRPDWVVLDGYHFAPDYQRAIRSTGCRLLIVDDIACWPEYHADILLNQNLNADQLTYKCDLDTIFLLGARYALLRSEFQVWRGWQRDISPVAHKVLVTFGGSDPGNVTLKIVRALQLMPVAGLQAVVVIGGSNLHAEALRSEIQSSKPDIRIVQDATNMPELMAWADVAVSAGGSTCWELAFMGLPALVVAAADNQLSVAEGLYAAGTALNLGWHENVSPEDISEALSRLLADETRRIQMVTCGQKLVDGDGGRREISAMRRHKAALHLRLAAEEDSRMIWEWANDPEVRAVSFSPAPILWDDHQAWLRHKLNDPNTRMFIVANTAGTPIGQVRFDVAGEDAVISVNLDRRFRGQGYGSSLIRTASRRLLETFGVCAVHAYIKPGNEISFLAFLKAGYTNQGLTIVHNQPAQHLVLQKSER